MGFHGPLGFLLHPLRLTQNLKMIDWKMMFLFQGCILRLQVNLPGVTTSHQKKSHLSTGRESLAKNERWWSHHLEWHLDSTKRSSRWKHMLWFNCGSCTRRNFRPDFFCFFWGRGGWCLVVLKGCLRGDSWMEFGEDFVWGGWDEMIWGWNLYSLRISWDPPMEGFERTCMTQGCFGPQKEQK